MSSNKNTVKSTIIKMIIAVISILIPVVFFKYGVFSRPIRFGFLRQWLTRPHIYLVLNLVIISIVASPCLFHYLICIFNYFKESENDNSDIITSRVEDVSELLQPSSTLSATTRTISPNGHFYQDWHDFINDQTPTSLSPTIERDSFDEPWLDINEVASSKKKTNSLHLQERVREGQSVKMITHLSSTITEINSTQEDNYDNSLESTWNAIKGIGDNKQTTVEKRETISPFSSIDTKEIISTSEFHEDNTLDTAWKAIIEIDDKLSLPSSLSLDESEEINFPSRLISPRVPRQDALAAWRELRKSETFNETVSVRQRAGLRRDPSLSLEDLNCRVESFIKNFNHQMRLQRQESHQRYLETINSGG